MITSDLSGPCAPWDAVIRCDLSQITGSAAVSGVALEAATEVLYALTGGRFGTCTVTIRPCRRSCNGGTGGPTSWWDFGTWPRPTFFDGVWYNVVCGSCITDCSCTVLDEVKLPRAVNSVTAVKVDGVTLATSAYDLQYTNAGPMLVRTDGHLWPLCNDFTKDDSQTRTWSVTATYGEPVPTLGQIAVGELTCEFIRALTDSEDCQLPPNTQTVVRQGITIEMLDPNTVFESGLTGLRFCDRFINTYNPGHLRERTKVYDVDGPGFRLTGR